MDARPPFDDALLTAAARREPDAVDAWFRAEHPPVWRLCLGFLADSTEADDAAQDAMLRLLDALPGFDARRPYRPWRTTIVLNHCRDRHRRRVTRSGHEEAAPLPAALPRPDEIAGARELRDLVTAALCHLSPREREAFVLHDLQAVPAAEAAATLDIAPSSLRSLLALARRRLRAVLGPRLPADSIPGGAP